MKQEETIEQIKKELRENHTTEDGALIMNARSVYLCLQLCTLKGIL